MEYEDPRALLSRLKLGREEFCQRLLTMLIVGGPHPRWNSRSTPTAAGAAFLRGLYEASFADDGWSSPVAFVDEFDLPRRRDDERGGAPDYAVLWDDRLWYIELKTEPGSHRRDQLPSYYALSAHHHPGLAIDITYLTPAMRADPPAVPAGCRYAHLTWDNAAKLVNQTWQTATPGDGEAEVRDHLLQTLSQLHLPPSQWRLGAPASTADVSAPAEVTDLPAAEQVPSRIRHDALHLAALTAEDGKQRALDWQAASLEELQELRLQVRDALRGHDENSPLRHVMPWLWAATASAGTPLTAAGGLCGYELRLSRYQRPLG
jgi:hypothetical protein